MSPTTHDDGRPTGAMATDGSGGRSGPAPAGSDEGGGVTRQRRQILLITIAAVAIYVTLRLLPTGTNLNHMDFRVQGGNSIEMCDPLNPQFISVVAARSPVTLSVKTDAPAVEGRAVRGTLTLRTSSGKAIAPADLLVVHTKLLHLMVVDPTLTDYQHVHPEPTATPGGWTFAFTPHRAGRYRLFADFTPVATGRGLYASVDVAVSPQAPGEPGIGAVETPAPAASPAGIATTLPTVEKDGRLFTLSGSPEPLRARQPIDFIFRITARDGGRVPLQPVMGAFAHLVAFDVGRTGFAHLHPAQQDLLKPPDATAPQLEFKLTIPNPGKYVIWAQVNIAGADVFVPFSVIVQ